MANNHPIPSDPTNTPHNASTNVQAAKAAVPATNPTTRSVADTVTAFGRNPRLEVLKMTNAHLRELADDDPLAVALDAAAKAAAVSRAYGTLPGQLTLTRNTSVTTTGATGTGMLHLAPTAEIRAALIAGERYVHDLLRSPLPAHRGERYKLFVELSRPIDAHFASRGLTRRGVAWAQALAQYAITHARPENLDFIDHGQLLRHLTDRFDDPAGPETTAKGRARGRDLLARERITWAHPNGPQHGLLIDRYHDASRPGSLQRDSWTAKKVAADLTLLAHYLGLIGQTGPTGDTAAVASRDALLGVRVMSHTQPNIGVHFTADWTTGGLPVVGTQHDIGGCEHCLNREPEEFTTGHELSTTHAPHRTLDTRYPGRASASVGWARSQKEKSSRAAAAHPDQRHQSPRSSRQVAMTADEAATRLRGAS